MNKSNKTLIAVVFTAALAVTSAFSQVITVDEFGNGNISGTPLTWSTNTVDPFSGLITLSYTLPFPGVRGDVILSEVPGQVSDLIRFDGNFNLFFYSDASVLDPSDSLADQVGFPGPLPVALSFQETGPEAGPNGLFGYTPGVNDPGFDTALPTYNFISDPAPVPEPGTLALLACGLGMFGFGWLRRKMVLKKSVKTLIATGFVGAITMTNAFSQTNLISVDEFGNGFYNGTPLAWSTNTVDPFSGLITLSYTLPFPTIQGDVILTDASGAASDLLRFDGNFTLFFYSDASVLDPSDSVADLSGFPASLQPNALTFQETGPEAGPNGLFGYNPGFTGPGANSAGALYNFISDPAPVPEPSILASLTTGLGIFGFILWRRKSSLT